MTKAERLVDGVRRGEPVSLTVDGEPIAAHSGETVAVAMLAAGRRTLRRTALRGSPRGLFCVMGACFDCLVIIDGELGVRSCMAMVEDGMVVSTGTR
jgi:predicted molibdopterin-dependent oxidoreductase YjgC